MRNGCLFVRFTDRVGVNVTRSRRQYIFFIRFRYRYVYRGVVRFLCLRAPSVEKGRVLRLMNRGRFDRLIRYGFGRGRVVFSLPQDDAGFSHFRSHLGVGGIFGNALEGFSVRHLRDAAEIAVRGGEFPKVLGHKLKGREGVVKAFESAGERTVCHGQDFARGHHLQFTFSPDLGIKLSRDCLRNQTIFQLIGRNHHQKVDLC